MHGDIRTLLAGPRVPDKEFIRSGPTFAQVYAMAAGLRKALAGYEGEGVCLATTNRAVMAAALLAALAGGPILLLPYALSLPAIARMQRLTGFTTAIADDATDLPDGTTIIRPPPLPSPALPASAPRPGTELLQIFTGGSTNAPQLWKKSWENMFGEGLLLARSFAVTEQDCIVATAPPYHIYGLLFSVILPLVSSASVVADTPSFPGEIAEAVQAHQATILASIPPHYRALRGKKLASAGLRLAFSSAGMLDEEDNRAFSQVNGVGIVEVYGSTETGGVASRNRFRGESAFTPFPVVSWGIKDHRLCVRSPWLSPGLPLADDGFFTTGDRVEAAGTGNGFTLKGRTDGVAKVGGKRVDLEEVHAVLKKAPGVSECVVTALPEAGSRGERIVALVQGTDVDIEQIRERLAASLEAYALPRAIKIINRIPVKENGKYDRDAIMKFFDA